MSLWKDYLELPILINSVGIKIEPLKKLIECVQPGHLKVNFIYKSNQHVVVRFDSQFINRFLFIVF